MTLREAKLNAVFNLIVSNPFLSVKEIATKLKGEENTIRYWIDKYKLREDIKMRTRKRINKVEENEPLEKNQQEDISNEEIDKDDILARKLAKRDFDSFDKRMDKLKREGKL